MGCRQRPEGSRQGEGQQVIAYRQQTGLLLLQPSLRLLAVTFGAVPIPTRVIAVVLVPTAITALQMASEESRATMLDISHGLQLPWRELVTGSERLTVEAEDLRHLQHEALKLVDDLIDLLGDPFE